MTIGMVFKDFFFFLLILLLGLFAGFHLEIDEDVPNFDSRISNYVSRMNEPENYNSSSDDFAGRLNILVADSSDRNIVIIELPYSYVHTLMRWVQWNHSRVCNDVIIRISHSKYYYFDNDYVNYEKLKNLKIGSYFMATDDDDKTQVYFWRSFRRLSNFSFDEQ